MEARGTDDLHMGRLRAEEVVEDARTPRDLEHHVDRIGEDGEVVRSCGDAERSVIAIWLKVR